jgi:uncharacterized protein
MVEILPMPLQDRQVVQRYDKGGFRVSDQEWRGGIIIFPTRTVGWPYSMLAELDIAAFAPIQAANDPRVELLIVGTGSKMALLPSVLRAELRAAGLAVDVMDTGAACRTYNILVGEERRVAAALLPVS